MIIEYLHRLKILRVEGPLVGGDTLVERVLASIFSHHRFFLTYCGLTLLLPFGFRRILQILYVLLKGQIWFKNYRYQGESETEINFWKVSVQTQGIQNQATRK